MRLVGINETEEYVQLRYNTTFKLSWSRVIDLMQVFLNDTDKESAVLKYFESGDSYIDIPSIPEGLLYKIDDLKECGGLYLSGKSTILESTMTLIAYNQTNIVDVYVQANENLYQLINKDNHICDMYMDSLEINARTMEAERYAINKVIDCVVNNDETAIKELNVFCNNIGAKNFPIKKDVNLISCFACKHEWEFDDKDIPMDSVYEVKCPNCKMILKRKKVK